MKGVEIVEVLEDGSAELAGLCVGNENRYSFSRHPAKIAFEDVTDSDPTIGINLSQRLGKFLPGANSSPIHMRYHGLGRQIAHQNGTKFYLCRSSSRRETDPCRPSLLAASVNGP